MKFRGPKVPKLPRPAKVAKVKLSTPSHTFTRSHLREGNIVKTHWKKNPNWFGLHRRRAGNYQ